MMSTFLNSVSSRRYCVNKSIVPGIPLSLDHDRVVGDTFRFPFNGVALSGRTLLMSSEHL